MLSTRLRLGLSLLFSLFAAAQASAQEPIMSPRWSYEVRGVYFKPDLELFEAFYGDDSDEYLGLAMTYRFSNRFELGGEYGLMKTNGVGLLTETGELGGSVEYRLDPFHVFANFIFQREPMQRVVPYVGAGLFVARYEQDVEFQPDIEGRTDAGWSARLGVRFQVGSHGPVPVRSRSDGSPYWRSYVFLEAQKSSAEVDDIDLGGSALLLGFRMEFDTK